MDKEIYEKGFHDGYREGYYKGLEQLIKQKELESKIVICFKCGKELNIKNDKE